MTIIRRYFSSGNYYFMTHVTHNRAPTEYQYSSFANYIREGYYASDWGILKSETLKAISGNEDVETPPIFCGH